MARLIRRNSALSPLDEAGKILTLGTAEDANSVKPGELLPGPPKIADLDIQFAKIFVRAFVIRIDCERGLIIFLRRLHQTEFAMRVTEIIENVRVRTDNALRLLEIVDRLPVTPFIDQPDCGDILFDAFVPRREKQR